MAKLEIKVMVIGLRAKTDFFDHDLDCFGFNLFLLFLLLVQELRIVDHLAYGRLCFGRNFNQVEIQCIGNPERIPEGVNTGVLNIIAYQANLLSPDFLIDPKIGAGIITFTLRFFRPRNNFLNSYN